MQAFEIAPARGMEGTRYPARDLNKCLSDLRFSGSLDKAATKRAELHFDKARLVFDGRTIGVIDVEGAHHPVPPSAVSLRLVREYYTMSRGIGCDKSWLALIDAAGRVLLLIANYGWSYDVDLAPWAAAGGLAFDQSVTTVGGHDVDPEKAFPGFGRAPRIDVGQPLKVARWWGWAKA